MEKEQFKGYVHQYIKIIALYLNKKKAPDFVIDTNTFAFFLRMSKYHSLYAFLFKALEEVEPNIERRYVKKLEEAYLANLRKAAGFEKERKALYRYLNDNDIDFLPLKGIIIKDYYPDQYTREFADNDILFDGKKDDLVKQFFIKNNYQVEYYRKSNHDVYQKTPFYNFEMHRTLFGESGDNEKVVMYFSDYLNKSLIKENKEHYLSHEDFYIYFTAHSYKHYHVSGCGFRTLIDYYLYLKKEQLDFDYINKELDKLDLLDFSNKIKTLSFKLFDEEPLNEEEEEMLLFIASSGTYGTLEHSVDKGVKEKGKFGYFMSRIFPPLIFYKTAYPWAYKTKILIPIAWCMRCFRVVFKSNKRMRQEFKEIRKHKKEE